MLAGLQLSAQIRELAVESGLLQTVVAVDDNCAFNATFEVFLPIGTLSFYPAHHITMGEGGCVAHMFDRKGSLTVDKGKGEVGRQDVVPEGLVPVDPRVQVLGASSDHLVLDVHDLPEPPRLGDSIAFIPNYAATLAAFTSPYVEKRFVG